MGLFRVLGPFLGLFLVHARQEPHLPALGPVLPVTGKPKGQEPVGQVPGPERQRAAQRGCCCRVCEAHPL